MMILLSSAANDVFWLGRYLARIEQLCQILPFLDDDAAGRYANAFGLKMHDAQSLNQWYVDPDNALSIPAQFYAVRNNIHGLRGVLLPQTFAELNALTKIKDRSISCLCSIAEECAAVLESEQTPVFLFYALGRAVEQLDQHCRLHPEQQVDTTAITNLLQLLADHGWQLPEQSWQTFCQQPDLNHLYGFCNDVRLGFEDCA